MSIPPLVCSTPPPPEQCEEDKDQEDFDLNYHLSQEEDDSNNYDYGNFSSFDHFKSTTSKTSNDFHMSQDESSNVAYDDRKDTNTESHSTKIDENNSKVALEDDILEDLNLEIDHEANTPKNLNEESNIIINKNEIKSLKDLQTDIPVDHAICQQTQEPRVDDSDIANVDTTEEPRTIDLDEKPEALPDAIITQDSDDNAETQTCNINTVDEIVCSNSNDDFVEIINTPQKQHIEDSTIEKKAIDSSELDDFEDFDDFQFASSVDNASTVLNSVAENPWQNEEPQNDGFGDFRANFGEGEHAALQNTEEPVQKVQDSEDEFGDFDEFKSVNDLDMNKALPESCDEMSVLNFQASDSENQIIERINKVMHTIFQKEITESDNVFEGKLEGSLGETWSYLRETDVRQPYIVNWNNSLAQKTLLKALCIDSRNILFGPKWSSNMPKYAANLSTAPLQPQKQTGQSNNAQSEITPSEKAVNKTWPDPFTSDGQEFTYAEALLLDLEHLMATLDQMAHNHSTLKISELLSHACHTESGNTVIETGPTDLDVFEAAISTKPDKIFSNTIGIQPIRQINLPDTHIFTPTNSEIPRSKTIHYDNASTPTVLLPQPVLDNTSAIQSTPIQTENDNDYWEFQDFRGTSDNKPLESTTNDELVKDQKDVTHKSNLPLATQVLQPIKLEPIMPTLNWPDPGEVKETFEDFSDFISNLPSSSDSKQESVAQNVISTNVQDLSKKDDKSHDLDKVQINKIKLNSNDKLDDEFEMFQSALPSFKNTVQSDFTTVENEPRDQASSSQVIPNKIPDFDVTFPNVEKIKSENISKTARPTENVLKNANNTSSILQAQPVPSTPVQMNSINILQPSIATSSTKQNQQKASQILQPLSLESYSQINWPNPGIDLQDLSRFNPVESLQSLKSDSNCQSKTASPVHSQKSSTNNIQTSDEDIWGDFVSSKPKQQQSLPKKQATFADDEEWTDFVSSPSVNPQNGLNTISLNVHTNLNMQKSSSSTKYQMKTNEISLDIPALNYITPKSNKSYNERHFQNL